MVSEGSALTLNSPVYGVWLDECGTRKVGEIDIIWNPGMQKSFVNHVVHKNLQRVLKRSIGENLTYCEEHRRKDVLGPI